MDVCRDSCAIPYIAARGKVAGLELQCSPVHIAKLHYMEVDSLHLVAVDLMANDFVYRVPSPA